RLLGRRPRARRAPARGGRAGRARRRPGVGAARRTAAARQPWTASAQTVGLAPSPRARVQRLSWWRDGRWPWPDGAGGATAPRGASAAADRRLQPLLPLDRRRERRHGLQRDPRGGGRRDARLRRLARRAVPR